MPRGRKEPKWKRDRAIELRREEGLTYSVIAERLGVTGSFVYLVLKAEGLINPRRKENSHVDTN